MLVIGITGGTGCGKTTLLREIETMGGCALDCDEIYHRLLAESKEMNAEIGAAFPSAVCGGALDRKALGRLVFGNEKELLRLNAITHKFVAREVDSRLADARARGARLAGVDAIALFEGDLAGKCDATVAVTASKEARISRIMRREGISREYAELRVSAQKDSDYFEKRCDYVLDNSFGDENEFRQECRKLLDILIKD